MVYGMTRSLKNEIVKFVPRGRVNAVCPGWTRTPMAEPGLADKAGYKRAMQTRAIPQISEPEDIAHITAFLASDKLANQITGGNHHRGWRYGRTYFVGYRGYCLRPKPTMWAAAYQSNPWCERGWRTLHD